MPALIYWCRTHLRIFPEDYQEHTSPSTGYAQADRRQARLLEIQGVDVMRQANPTVRFPFLASTTLPQSR